MPTIVACTPLLILMWARGAKIATSWKAAPLLIAGSLAGQLIGNLLFQISLGIIGLALSVPLCLSSMIIGGALLGRWMLGDPVSRRTIVAIGLLIIATCVLSFGTSTPSTSVVSLDGGWRIGFGVVSAFVSGIAFAFFSVTMRNALRGGMAVPMTMITSGLVGTIVLWPIAIGKLGVSQIASIEAGQWFAMIIAGCCNTLAFFLLSFALRTISVISVNLLNATQAGLAAIFGVFWFGEPLTTPLLIGSGLTIIGLVVLGTGKREKGGMEERVKEKLASLPRDREDCEESRNMFISDEGEVVASEHSLDEAGHVDEVLKHAKVESGTVVSER
jgi:drug/metabolite transporter (DMT)-like permease